jgi:nucleotide-binding universal stress UspA family protein
MAKEFEGKLYILHILESRYASKYRGFVKDISTGEEIGVTGDYLAKVKRAIESIYRPSMGELINYSIEVKEGFPYLEILRTARREKIDLIVMAPHAHVANAEGVVRTFGTVGSSLEGVAASSRCPVMVVAREPKRAGVFNKILIPIDFSKGSERAFDLALQMTRHFQSKVYILSVPELMPSPGRLCCPQPELEMHVALAKQRAKEMYGCKLKTKEIKSYVIDAWEGIPYVEILKFARIYAIDIVVMGPHAKEENPTWYLGNTVEQVSMRSQCPVVVVGRPELLRSIDGLE